MSRSLLLISFALLIGLQSQAQTNNPQLHSRYVWTKVLDSAGWRKSYNFQMFTQHDTAWVFHHDGNWYSTNGKTWAKSQLGNAIANLAFLDYVQFKGAMYGLGHFEGNIEHFTFKPVIYRTTDFKHWQILSVRSNLPARFFYHPFVFNHKIWIIGGEDKDRQYSDIWNSADGITWIKQRDNLPFGKRNHSQVVVFKGKLFLLNSDVWTSTNGLDWTLLAPEILKGEQVFGYTPVVYDNKIWLVGCNRNGRFYSQVLVSSDGKNWAGQTAPWTPRGAMASTVFKGKIYITGGKYGGMPNHPDFRYSNDVWTLEKK